MDKELADHDNEQISYFRLKNHIENAHPHKAHDARSKSDDLDTFSICEGVGDLPCMNCCFDKEVQRCRISDKEVFEGNVIKINDINRKIGLGPSLYLMTVKSLCCFFFLMTILNVPVYYFYYSGGQVDATKTTDAAVTTSNNN